MNLRRHFKHFSAILIVMACLIAVSALLPTEPAQALDYTAIETGLNTWQYYFSRTVMSLALKDYYDTGVLPSITAGQAFFEGGCAGAPISIIAQNHFGIKAFSNWEGKVFDNKTHELYNSYSDVVNIKGASYANSASLWRAYDTWEEGIADHSNLLLTESKYGIVLAAKDYTEAAHALVRAGYCSDADYPSHLINYIERYGFDQLDSVTADENGVFGLIMDRSRAELAAGETISLTASAYPAPEAAIDIVWNSDRPDVASVDANGNVTAHKQGYTLITATYHNKEACCVICVDANGYVMDQNLYIYAEPDKNAATLGRMVRGQPLRVNSETVYTAADGTAYYAVSAGVGNGAPVSGYAAADYIYIGSEVRLSMGTPKTVYHQSVGDSVTIPLEIYAEELKDKPITWQSSMNDVVSVTEDGTFTAHAEGVAVISILLDGKTALTVTVYVGDEAYETLIANANVYLRAGPSQSASILGTVIKGDQVKLISEPANGWYLILAEVDGKTLQGYSYSRYFDAEDPGTGDGSSDDSSFDETSSDETSSDGTSSDGTSSDTSSDDTSSDETILVPYPAGKVNVDDALNVRNKPGMDGEKVARLLNGDRVIILGDIIYIETEPTYKDWYHIRFDYAGEQMEGYVCAEFLLLDGTIDVPMPKPNAPVSDKYLVGELYVTEIPAETTLGAFAETFATEIRVFRSEGETETELTAEDILASGDELRIYVGDIALHTRILVVKGDVSGDGAVDARDYLMTKRAVLGTYVLEGAFARAAMLDDETLDVRDYMMIKRVALGTYRFSFVFDTEEPPTEEPPAEEPEITE